MTLRIRRITREAVVPKYSKTGDAGPDVSAAESVSIEPGEIRAVRTGIAIELPTGTEGQIRPRSGLALNYGITVLNSPGTIDQGYRGELRIVLINHGQARFEISTGMHIAQLVVAPVLPVDVAEVEQLSASERGEGGFGSTDE